MERKAKPIIAKPKAKDRQTVTSKKIKMNPTFSDSQKTRKKTYAKPRNANPQAEKYTKAQASIAKPKLQTNS